MNPLEQMTDFINVLVACTALMATEQKIGMDYYQVQHWVCQTQNGPIAINAWRRPCQGGHTASVSRLIFLEIAGRGNWYTEQFGGVMVDPQARLEDAYQTVCGS